MVKYNLLTYLLLFQKKTVSNKSLKSFLETKEGTIYFILTLYIFLLFLFVKRLSMAQKLIYF